MEEVLVKMDDVDELDLDDELFSTAPPITNITRALNRNPPCIGEPPVAVNILSAAMGTVTQSQAASKESNTCNRAPLKPLASLLHIPTFPRSPKGSNPPAQLLPSRPAQREDSSKGRTTQNEVLRANKRPAEEHSNLLSKRLVSGPGQGLSTVWNTQASLGRPAMHTMLAPAPSGFRPPSAPSQEDPQHVGQGSVSQQEAQSFKAPSSPAMSTQQGVGSSSFIIPGPAGLLQQRSGQQLPSLNPTSSHNSHSQSFASLHDDFAVSAAWQSAMGVANVNSVAGAGRSVAYILEHLLDTFPRELVCNKLPCKVDHPCLVL